MHTRGLFKRLDTRQEPTSSKWHLFRKDFSFLPPPPVLEKFGLAVENKSAQHKQGKQTMNYNNANPDMRAAAHASQEGSQE